MKRISLTALLLVTLSCSASEKNSDAEERFALNYRCAALATVLELEDINLYHLLAVSNSAARELSGNRINHIISEVQSDIQKSFRDVEEKDLKDKIQKDFDEHRCRKLLNVRR